MHSSINPFTNHQHTTIFSTLDTNHKYLERNIDFLCVYLLFFMSEWAGNNFENRSWIHSTRFTLWLTYQKNIFIVLFLESKCDFFISQSEDTTVWRHNFEKYRWIHATLLTLWFTYQKSIFIVLLLESDCSLFMSEWARKNRKKCPLWRHNFEK